MISGSLLSLANGSAEQWIVDTLWATTLLMAAALVLRKPVAKFFGPEIAYLLWAAPVIRLFMPALTETIIVPASAPNEPVLAMPFAVESLASTAAPPTLDWLTIAFTLWIGGAALFLVTQIAAYLQHRRELLEDALPVGNIGNIQLVEIANISGPFAFGLFERFIALPIGFNRQFDPVERDLALAHEQSHHRAGDLWMNFIGLFLLALHWFNPVAWFAWRSFRFDQEAACDARVIRGRPALERAAYARAIAKAATGRTLALASPLNPKHKLVSRLKLMAAKEQSASRKGVGLALLGTASATAMALTATVTYAWVPAETPVAALTDAPPAPDAMEPWPAALVQVADVPAAPLAPIAPVAPQAPVAPVKPVMKDGVYIYEVPRPNGTVTLRLDRKISQTELQHRVEHAEQSRHDAESHLRHAERTRAIAIASAERGRAAAEASAEAATLSRSRAKGNGWQINGSSDNEIVIRDKETGEQTLMINGENRGSIRVEDCEGRSRDAAFMTQYEVRNGKKVKSKIVTCGQMAPDLAEVNARMEAGMKLAYKQMAAARAMIENDIHISATDRAEALADLDQDMKDMRRDLEEAKRELKRELEEARRERTRS